MTPTDERAVERFRRFLEIQAAGGFTAAQLEELVDDEPDAPSWREWCGLKAPPLDDDQVDAVAGDVKARIAQHNMDSGAVWYMDALDAVRYAGHRTEREWATGFLARIASDNCPGGPWSLIRYRDEHALEERVERLDFNLDSAIAVLTGQHAMLSAMLDEIRKLAEQTNDGGGELWLGRPSDDLDQRIGPIFAAAYRAAWASDE